MSNDAQLQLLNLLFMLSLDRRLDGFQGIHMTKNGSVAVVHRWGGMRFESIDGLVKWLAAGEPVRTPESKTQVEDVSHALNPA